MRKLNVIQMPGLFRPFVAGNLALKPQPQPRPASTQPVPKRPVQHRKRPQYMEACRERVNYVVDVLVRDGVVVAKHRTIAEFAIWSALYDARTAGFGAGMAFGLSRGRR